MLCKKQRKGEGNRRQLALLQSKEGPVHQLCYTLCPLAVLQKGKLLCLSPILGLKRGWSCITFTPADFREGEVASFHPNWFPGSVWPHSWTQRCWLSAVQAPLTICPDWGHLAELVPLRPCLLPPASNLFLFLQQVSDLAAWRMEHNPIISCFCLLLIGILDRQVWREENAVCAAGLGGRGLILDGAKHWGMCARGKPEASGERL